jgi:hypothetical protein
MGGNKGSRLTSAGHGGMVLDMATTTNPITLDTVKAEALKVIEQFGPEHTNPLDDSETCVYTDPDGAHCIAGQIMVNLGQPIPGIDHVDNSETVMAVEMWFGVLTADAEEWLARVQRQADNGYTWAGAVARVEDGHPDA